MKWFKEYLSYDPATGHLTWLKMCGRGRPGEIAGTIEKKGYLRVQVKGHRVLCHRVAWYFIHGSLPRYQVDHINGNKADNRAENLRHATNAQNQANRGKNKNNTSGYKGVTWRKDSKKWRAHVGKGGKKYCLGSFDKIEDAIAAHAKGSKKLFGEFAAS